MLNIIVLDCIGLDWIVYFNTNIVNNYNRWCGNETNKQTKNKQNSQIQTEYTNKTAK